jgi:hypothetical protein
LDVLPSPDIREADILPAESPPWGKPAQWTAIQERIDSGLRRGGLQAQSLRRQAQATSDRIAALSPFMEELAAATCIRCPWPCCLTAKIWFDAKDLLVLHLSHRPVPPAQTIATMADRCRYLGPRGCRLDRLDRPWVCTWYLCPTQKDRLRKEDAAAYDRLQREMKEIGTARKQMLAVFLQAVCSESK